MKHAWLGLALGGVAMAAEAQDLVITNARISDASTVIVQGGEIVVDHR